MSEIITGRRRHNFTMIDNEATRNYNLSLDSLGLLTHLLSHAENYVNTTDSIMKKYNVSKRQMKRILKELRDAGYLKMKAKKEGKFFTGQKWEVDDIPQLADSNENQQEFNEFNESEDSMVSSTYGVDHNGVDHDGVDHSDTDIKKTNGQKTEDEKIKDDLSS